VILAAFTVDWYAARAAGVVAYLLVSSTVAPGLLLAGKERLDRWPRFAVEDVHRFAGLLTGTFVSPHVLTLFVDSYVPFSLTQFVLLGASSYRPLSTALGVVAAELLLALAITNRYRKRLSYRFWRRAHYLNFAVWGLALFHGIFAGTDRVALWADLLYGCSAAAVAGFVAWRATGGGLRPPAATPANSV
jgi:predicted ferric reductase